ncbi:hypothetical protein SAMN04488061_2887 [Filomicrobium insigne]|uniref:Uncharacterized protein n=1 Tax=Filomicrobium insigne TaxID=418854 RepID=A0A1H0SGK8_9HYPH|nr:hypothetical protein [Filomicrobium insigne]SDP40820.1 hypothetical protein SAMN04488061_2887 [Filomicrobium insigne]
MVLPFSPSLLGVIGKKKIFSREYITSASYNSGGAAHTFNGVNIGSPASDRLVAVCAIYAWNQNTNFTTISIGGVDGDIVGQNDGSNVGMAIAYRRVTGSITTADIVVNYSGTPARSEIHVFRISGQTSDVPYDFHFPAGGGASNRSATLDLPAKGGLIAAAYDAGSGSWTNATEDAQLSESSCASSVSDTLQSGLTVTCSGNVRAIGAVSWA